MAAVEQAPGYVGQLRPGDTTAATLVVSGVKQRRQQPIRGGQQFTIATLYVCNTTAGNLTFRVFWDEDGTTYDESTALYWDEQVAVGVTKKLELNIKTDSKTGSLGVRSSAGNGITFTAFS